MSQQELLNRLVQILTAVGIDYMVTGSLASSLQGEPRSTHDIDLVVVMPAEAVPKLMEAFPPPDYYLSEESIRDALRQRSMFNLLSLIDGEKVDFWILGSQLKVSAPEDTILVKLHWAKISGGSEKQFTDVLRVYEVQAKNLDLDYLNRWASQLGVEELWQRVQLEAEPV
jgi:hypothetical protein